MAVNTAALKTFAPAMRRQLMEAVGRKLDLLLNSQTPDTLSTYAKQIAELRDEQEKGLEQLLERVAYTWFNRLCALRYLDAKGWHPFGCKVLMPADDSETQPELLKLMRSGSLLADLKTFTNEQRLNQLLDGQIPPAIPGGDAQGEVYRELVLAACRSYHHLLPDLFEGLDDASELLLPDDLLTESSIAGSFRSAISDFDCDDVEIIGWLYQFYISEKRDQVFGKIVKSEDIPAATQLFTPNWIVKYMVQNSLGATWLATYPDSPVKSQMEFYIEPAEQTPEVQNQLAGTTPESLDPEELTLIDPACGSGHILVEAYDLLKSIYLERGYRQRDIPELILTKNLYGLDICPRAAQLAAFSMLMKGREDDRRLLERDLTINVMALQDSKGFNAEHLATSTDLNAAGISRNDLQMLCEHFTHATTFGSLIAVSPALAAKLQELEKLAAKTNQNLITLTNFSKFRSLVRQTAVLTRKYDAVVANPPYMGSRGMNALAKEFARVHYPQAKSDLFACFIQRGYSFAKPTALEAMVTMQSWMFLSSFEAMRDHLLTHKTIVSLAHFGARAFASIPGEVVQTCALILRNSPPGSYRPSFFRLTEGGEVEKKHALGSGLHRYDLKAQEDLKKIPGHPIAYWISSDTSKAFARFDSIEKYVSSSNGVQTGNNSLYTRLWPEVNKSSLGNKWVLYNKGGSYRKWYGNIQHVILWENNGITIKSQANSCIRGESLYYKDGVTWSYITSGSLSARYLPAGCIFDAAGPCAFANDETRNMAVLSMLNTPDVDTWSKLINPTINFQVGDFKKLVFSEQLLNANVSRVVKSLVDISKSDWDEYELSTDFRISPILELDIHSISLKISVKRLLDRHAAATSHVHELEIENYKNFLHAYCLPCPAEAGINISIEGISLNANPLYRFGVATDTPREEIASLQERDLAIAFLSYATGCMMGRYSLDHPGLILADSRSNQDEQLAAYEAKIGKPISEIKFQPDADAIIPVLDGEWFEDDIVARTREFLKVTFPESSVAENLRFLEDSIGKDIRKYFCKDFYKDHLQTYKKRPIYWMVQSPKAGFACLIYLHRYTPDTLLQVLNNYFRPYLQKLEARQEQLERDQNNDSLPKREQTAARKEAEKITKVLKECQAWEQDALLPLAQQRIELDLDDGVKVNYLKLQEVLAKIPGLAAKGD